MKYTLEFSIDHLPKRFNQSMGASWRARHGQAKLWRKLVSYAVGFRAPAKPLEKAKCTFTRFSSVEPDFDNLVQSFKVVVDSLKQFGVIADDKPSNIGQSEYRWQKASPGKGKITVRVEEV